MDFLKRNAMALLFVFAFLFVVWDSHQRVESSSAAVKALAFNLAVDDCRRDNPENAYVLLRAEALPRSGDQETGFTAGTAPKLYQLLDCNATVTQGKPVPLNAASSGKYLRIFQEGRVPITRGQKIVDSVDFKTYFEGLRNP